MLGDANACATIAVNDIQKAKQFYGDVLGLKEDGGDDQMGLLYKSGESRLFVYPSEFAGTNKATYVAWQIDDVDGVATKLKEKGVSLEHYDNLPGTKLEGDVHVMGDMRAIWFKDPDGNILNVVNGM